MTDSTWAIYDYTVKQFTIVFVIVFIFSFLGCDYFEPAGTKYVTITTTKTISALTVTTTQALTTPPESTTSQPPAPGVTVPVDESANTDITGNSPAATAQLLPELEQVDPTEQLINREYKWDYDGREWTWELAIPQTLYDYYKALPRSPTKNYSVYVTHPLDDEYIDVVTKKLTEIAAQRNFNGYQTVSFAAAFVQSLEYTSDTVTTGFDEYPRYPVETLVDNGGDCEDTSILLAAIIKDMGYGVVLLRFSATTGASGHLAVGVKGSEGVYGNYWNYQDSKYYYIETTGNGWEIGELPEEYENTSAYIYGMNPVPILTHDWRSTGSNGYAHLTVEVENLGSAVAEEVSIYAGFDAGNDQCWNGRYAPSFVVDINETATVNLDIKFPYGEYTRLLVQIIYDGYAVDESFGKWVQFPSY